MALSNYTELKAAVATLLNRSDLTSSIPDFIKLAEAQMARKVRSREMEGWTTVPISSETAQIPSDFRRVISFRVTGSPNTPLDYVQPDRLDDFGGTFNGKPQYYTIVGRQFIFYPHPATGGTSYTARLRYLKALDAIDDTNPCNWVLERNPDAYLYGAALQSAPFLKDDARIAVWQQFFASAIADINDEAISESSGSTLQPNSHGADYDRGMNNG